ncbi:hypothetical protein F2Q69_00003352 [Brassica cretica]|uniref:Uncharacterized protein n=1 Tax=Brassica cretica TaxID=69181 RepID=A0A8S9PDQ6_BRACR|nr:hypothetical protein F2Q69_00003352 [Brassica cretica]
MFSTQFDMVKAAVVYVSTSSIKESVNEVENAPHAPKKVLSPKNETRSLSFALHRRRARRRSPPPTMTRKRKPKKNRYPGSSPTGSATRSGSSAAPISPSTHLNSTVDDDASTPPTEEAQQPGSSPNPASSPSPQIQDSSAPIVNSAKIPNSQASATVEIVPENQDLEATSTNYITGEHPHPPVQSDVEIPSATPTQQIAPSQACCHSGLWLQLQENA